MTQTQSEKSTKQNASLVNEIMSYNYNYFPSKRMIQICKVVKPILNCRLSFLFIILIRLTYPQVLPYGKPQYFAINPETITEELIFTNGKYQITKLHWQNSTKLILENNALFYLHLGGSKCALFGPVPAIVP